MISLRTLFWDFLSLEAELSVVFLTAAIFVYVPGAPTTPGIIAGFYFSMLPPTWLLLFLFLFDLFFLLDLFPRLTSILVISCKSLVAGVAAEGIEALLRSNSFKSITLSLIWSLSCWHLSGSIWSKIEVEASIIMSFFLLLCWESLDTEGFLICFIC